MSVNLEREAKLQVPAGFRLPELGGDGLQAVPRPVERLVTTYVDTPDLRIARWGSSLRHRKGEGWTVKLPSAGEGGSLLARREHVFDGEDPRKLPVAAADLVRAFVRGGELAPVARLQTKRTAVELRDELGRSVATVTDDEVSVMDGRRVGARFRELEVELDPATSAEVAEAVVARLREAGGSVENVSKLRRALGPVAEEGPDVVVDELDGDVTVVRVVRRALAASAARLIVHDPGVRVGEDPEEVHQARVATRRLRSDLRTFRDMVDPAWAQPLREELQWLGSALGAVRDADVLRDRLRSRIQRLPDADRAEADDLLEGLDVRRAEAREVLLGSMREPRYVELLDSVVDAAHDPRVVDEVASSPAREVLAPVLERPWKHLETSIEHVLSDPSDEALHAARIRAKRVRYAAEAVAPVFGKTARKFAEAAADLQDVLGEHQDAVVARAWLREGRTGAHAFVAGQLAALEAEASRAARARWQAAWKALARKRLRFWT